MAARYSVLPANLPGEEEHAAVTGAVPTTYSARRMHSLSAIR